MRDGRTRGQRIADGTVAFIGSWRFLVVQTVVLLAWVAVNAAWRHRWDPYPFILLNLTLSFQAAYASPLILLSENRQKEEGRRLVEEDKATNERAEREIRRLEAELTRLKNELAEAVGPVQPEPQKGDGP